MKKGFTMIELIFVIVILGILAAVALPRLAATRDDAEVARTLSNLSTAINDITTSYVAQAALPKRVIDVTNVDGFKDTEVTDDEGKVKGGEVSVNFKVGTAVDCLQLTFFETADGVVSFSIGTKEVVAAQKALADAEAKKVAEDPAKVGNDEYKDKAVKDKAVKDAKDKLTATTNDMASASDGDSMCKGLLRASSFKDMANKNL